MCTEPNISLQHSKTKPTMHCNDLILRGPQRGVKEETLVRGTFGCFYNIRKISEFILQNHKKKETTYGIFKWIIKDHSENRGFCTGSSPSGISLCPSPSRSLTKSGIDLPYFRVWINLYTLPKIRKCKYA